MHDYMTIQAEVDFRRERLTRSMGRRRGRKPVDRTRIPFVGDERLPTGRGRAGGRVR